MTTRATVQVNIHDADEATWAALAQVFDVKTAEAATWVKIKDADTGVEVAFFKAKGESDGTVESARADDGPNDA